MHACMPSYSQAYLAHQPSPASTKRASPRSSSIIAVSVLLSLLSLADEVAAPADRLKRFRSRLAECNSQMAWLLHSTAAF